MTYIIARLLRYSRLRLILFLFIAVTAAELAIAGLLYLLDPANLTENILPESLSEIPPLGLFALLVLAAPMLETLIFQWGLLMLVKKATRWIAKSDSWLPAFLISSLAFAGVHYYNEDTARLGFLYVLRISPTAFSLSMLAVVEREREAGGRPVIAVFALHALNNLLVFALLVLFPEE